MFLPFSAALLVAMLAAWWTAAELFTDVLEKRLQQRLTHATDVLAAGTFPLTAELLAELAELQNAQFMLLDAHGRIALSTAEEPVDESLVEILRKSWPAGSARHPDYAVVIRPLEPVRSAGYSAIAGVATLHDVQTAAGNAALTLGALMVAGVAVVAWWGHRLSIAITRPLRQLRDMAQRIAGGDRDVKADPPAIRELADLTRAVNDMTGRLADYEAELVAGSRLASLGEMAARMAHEIRNPLTAMKLQAQLLCEGLAGEHRMAAERLLAEIQRLQLIVSSTLAHGRPVELQRAPCTLDSVAAEVVDLVAPQFAHRRIQLDRRLDPTPCIHLDGDRLKQVLFNLLCNAADALPDGGQVRVSAAAVDGTVLLEVEDSGPGVAAERAAELFRRAVPSSKTNGLGLGLVVSREIVEGHGGTIELDCSPALGGARFTVRLPAGPAA